MTLKTKPKNIQASKSLAEIVEIADAKKILDNKYEADLKALEAQLASKSAETDGTSEDSRNEDPDAEDNPEDPETDEASAKGSKDDGTEEEEDQERGSGNVGGDTGGKSDDKEDDGTEEKIDPEDDEEDECDKTLETPEEATKSLALRMEEKKAFLNRLDKIANKTIDALFKEIGFPHILNQDTNTLTIHYGMSASGNASRTAPDIGNVGKKDAFSRRAGGNSDFRPTAKEHTEILALTNKYYPPEKLKVFYADGSDSAVDRHSEHFGNKAQSNQAKQSYNQPMLQDHNYYKSEGVFGKIFGGKVSKREDGVKYVRFKFFMLDTPKNQDVIEGFESGVNNKLSVGVRVPLKSYLCDICKGPVYKKNNDPNSWSGYTWCGHYAGMEMDDGTICTCTIDDISDFLECSRVTVPAQKNAAVQGGTDDSGTEASPDQKMFLQKTVTAAQQNTEVAKISVVDLNGETEMPGTGTKKVDEKPDETVAKNTVDAPAVFDGESLKALNALVEAQTIQQKDLSELVSSLKAATEENVAAKAELEKRFEAIESEKTEFKKTLDETRGFLKSLAKLQKGTSETVELMATKVNKLAEMDIAEITDKMASLKSEKMSNRDSHVNAKGEDSEEFYTEVMDRF